MALKTFGQRLKAVREARNKSQTDLARDIGVSQPSILSMESGKTEKTKHLLALAKALEVDPEWLQLGEGAEPMILAGDSAQRAPKEIRGARLRGNTGQLMVMTVVDVVGVAGVGVWSAREDRQRRGIVWMPPHHLIDHDAFGLTIVDDHADRLGVPKGSVAVFVLYSKFPDPIPKNGDAVLAEHVREDDTVERTVREFLAVDGGARVATNTSRRELFVSTDVPKNADGKLPKGGKLLIHYRKVGVAMLDADIQALSGAR